MSKTTTVPVVAAVGFLLTGAGGVWWIIGAGSPDPGGEERVATGRRLYVEHCASCHGVNLEGQSDWQVRKADGRMPAPPHDASGHTWHHPDETLYVITRDGLAKHAPPGYQTDMPGFGGSLSEEQIRAVLTFIRSTWPSEIRARHDAAPVQPRR